jgi:hypothetical protein
VRLEGLGQLKKSTSSGIQTGYLPVCNIVPQPTHLIEIRIMPNSVSPILLESSLNAAAITGQRHPMADVRLMKYHQNIEGYTVYGKR